MNCQHRDLHPDRCRRRAKFVVTIPVYANRCSMSGPDERVIIMRRQLAVCSAHVEDGELLGELAKKV